MGLEGGFFGIRTDEGNEYLPINLDEEYRKSGLRVSFEAVPVDVMTIQMWGTPVEIKDIKLEKILKLFKEWDLKQMLS